MSESNKKIGSIEKQIPQEENLELRNKNGILDKVIGNEDQLLAKKRLTAIKHSMEMSEKSKNKNIPTSAATSSEGLETSPDPNQWIQLGPTWHPNGQTYSEARVNVSGRITSIVINPNDPNILFIGTAQGGVWKSIDLGLTWIPTSDESFSLAIGALAIDKSNPSILYAGTGEANFSGDSQYGLGLIKTTDSGKSWTPLGMEETSIENAPAGMIGFLNSRFSRIVIHPNESTTIFAATVSSGRPNVASGIYRSKDGGKLWKRLENGLPPVNSIGATDIIIHPSNNNIAYVAFYGDGIYKTNNLNDDNPTWSKLSSGLPSGNFNRLVLDISRSQPNILYTLMSNNESVLDKFYTSHDEGNTWSRISLPNGDIGGQGFYNMNIAIDPSNSNIVYLSGISLWKAIHNQGSNSWEFQDIGKEIHPDNHAFAFDPTNSKIIYAGNDGGIFRSIDGGKNWNDGLNKGICITQFEFMDQDPNSEKIVLAGTQDNGTIKYIGEEKFYHSADGDGGFVCIDPNNANNMWHTYYKMSPEYSIDGGSFENWQGVYNTIFNEPSSFYPPLALDKSNSNNVAIGGNVLHLDNNRGKNGWQVKINPNLSGQRHYITAINYVNSNLIYIGTSMGHLYKIIKSTDNWDVLQVDGAQLPERYIWDVATATANDNRVFVVMSGFGTGHIFRGDVQANGTYNWERMDNQLPDNPANAIVIDDTNPEKMYVGMDVGVFTTTNGGNNWTKLGKGLPNVQIYDMRLHSQSQFLRVVTHGRGLWQLKVE
ncbi:MAG TPA: hypothetical protein VFG45_03395 [Candidatus Nitrosocosmicus sp.]|nr:hypothetical protein [Candidatus Nitrosocosmicus sp.]